MARFRLLQPHSLRMITAQGMQLVYLEAKTEIESSAMQPGWTPTALMEALDSEAAALLQVECDRLRSPDANNPGGCIIGIGPIAGLPA